MAPRANWKGFLRLSLVAVRSLCMLDLAKHIVNQKTADFEPAKFEDHYEEG
jgi:non-homologous end joining protein Ku